MAKVLLISRLTLEKYSDKLKQVLDTLPVGMAVALAPEDADLAKTHLTPAVAQFQHNTAIVADFPGDLVVHEDGSIEPFPLFVDEPEEPKLIAEV